ncbi:hypothetical protein QYF61_014554 [Mycteria americana]|uniref:TOG domain-containing protein n=1 Tax=Mycteria americana TaxID=33587 RepID=A0AAN7S528_MYCAM|nr:hypothetical protein QYF61_014554 [Mycteria americana]
MALRVLQQLSTAMGSNIKQHMKDLGFPLIALFRESKSSIRAATLAAMNAWAAQINVLEWLDGQDISEDLGQQQGRADSLTGSPASLPFFVMHLGFEKVTEATSDLKAAAKDQVLVILENANDSLTAQSAASAKSLSRHPRVTTMTTFPSVLTTPPAATALSSQGSAKEPAPKTSEEEKQGPKEPKAGEAVLKDTGAAKGKTQMNSTLKDGVSKLGPIFTIVPKGKEQRMRDKKGSKVLQWNFTAPSNRYVKQLKAQMSSCVSSSFQLEMFHSSFLHHTKALAIMARHSETEKEGVISCLNLILKWLTLCFFDTNTWVLIKSLVYLSLLLTLLIQEKYQLMDNEAFSFLPYLVLKMGEPRQTVLKLVCAVLKRISGDTDTSIQAMKEIEEILRQTNKAEAMSGHINEFLVASFQSLKFINEQKEADKKWGKEKIILQCNCVIQACNCVFQKKLVQAASVEVLKDLLQGSLTAEGNPDKFSDLLAKHLWRTTWFLPGTISTIKLDENLLDAHMLMKALSKEKLRQCSDKLPLWTLKTLLHNFCKLKGVRILDHLTVIEDAAGSKVEAYL